MAVAAVLIDLDGTLWDSAPWVAQLLAGEDRRARSDLTKRLRDPSSGLRSAVLLREHYTPAGFARACLEHGTDLQPYEGALTTLRQLHKRVSLGVVTSLPAWMAIPMLGEVGADGLMEVVQCAQRGLLPKPHPGGLNRALATLRAAPTATLYVGDTRTDNEASSAAGIGFAWASWGYETVPRPDHKLTRWKDLEELT